jgi:hypothetical protein
MLNEHDIQDIVYYNLRNGVLCPNVYIYAWESDLIYVNENDYVIEFEIKISRSDFKHDFVKKDKHAGLIAGERPLADYFGGVNSNGKISVKTPNRFYYLCPEGLLLDNDMPKYAGLYWIVKADYYPGGYILKRQKLAPLLHKDKVEPKQLQTLLNSIRYRYWNLRIKVKMDSRGVINEIPEVQEIEKELVNA